MSQLSPIPPRSTAADPSQPRVETLLAALIHELRLPDTSNSIPTLRMTLENRDAILRELIAFSPEHGLTVAAALRLPPSELFEILTHSAVILRHPDFCKALSETLRIRQPFVDRPSEEHLALKKFSYRVAQLLDEPMYPAAAMRLPERPEPRAWYLVDELKTAMRSEMGDRPTQMMPGNMQKLYDQFAASGVASSEAVALEASRSLQDQAACEARGTYVTSVSRSRFVDRLGQRLLEEDASSLRGVAERVFARGNRSSEEVELLVSVVSRYGPEAGAPNSPARRDYDRAVKSISGSPRLQLMAFLLRSQEREDLVVSLQEQVIPISAAQAIVEHFKVPWAERDWQNCANAVVNPAQVKATVARAIAEIEGSLYRECLENGLPPGRIPALLKTGYAPETVVTSPGIIGQNQSLRQIFREGFVQVSERGLILVRMRDRTSWLCAPGLLSPNAPEHARWAEAVPLPNSLAYSETQLVGDYCCIILNNNRLHQVYYRTRLVDLPVDFAGMVVAAPFLTTLEYDSRVFLSGYNRTNNQRQFISLNDGNAEASPVFTFDANEAGAVVLTRPIRLGSSMLLGAKPGTVAGTSNLILHSFKRGFYELFVPAIVEKITSDDGGRMVWMVAQDGATGARAAFRLDAYPEDQGTLALTREFVTSGSLSIHHCAAGEIIEEQRPDGVTMLRRSWSKDKPFLTLHDGMIVEKIDSAEDNIIVISKRVGSRKPVPYSTVYYCSVGLDPSIAKVDLAYAYPGLAVGDAYILRGHFHEYPEERVICFTRSEAPRVLPYLLSGGFRHEIIPIAKHAAMFLGRLAEPDNKTKDRLTLVRINYSPGTGTITSIGHAALPDFKNPNAVVLSTSPRRGAMFIADGRVYSPDGQEVLPGFEVRMIIRKEGGNVERFAPFGAIVGRRTNDGDYEIQVTNAPSIMLRYDAEPKIVATPHGVDFALVTVVGVRQGLAVVDQFTVGTVNSQPVYSQRQWIDALTEGKPIDRLLQDAEGKIPQGIFVTDPPLAVQSVSAVAIGQWAEQLIPGNPTIPKPARARVEERLMSLVWGRRSQKLSSSVFPSARHGFTYQARSRLAAGDPREPRRGEPVLVVRGGRPSGFIITERLGPWDSDKNGWGDLSFQRDEPRELREGRSFEFSIAARGGSQVRLPVITGGEIDPLSIRSVPRSAAAPTDVRRNDAGTMVVDLPFEATGVTYTVRVARTSRAVVWPNDASLASFFSEQFPTKAAQVSNEQRSEHALPDVFQKLLEPLRRLAPMQRLSTLDRIVRQAGLYDINSKERQIESPGSCIREAMARLEEIRLTRSVSRQKIFAGVCGDFAVIWATLAHDLGFVAGVDCGFRGTGKRYFAQDEHVVGWVALPQADGVPHIVQFDPTAGLSLTETLGAESRRAVDAVMRGVERLKKWRAKTSAEPLTALSQLPGTVDETADAAGTEGTESIPENLTDNQNGTAEDFLEETLEEAPEEPIALPEDSGTALVDLMEPPPSLADTALSLPPDSGPALQAILEYWRFGRLGDQTIEAVKKSFVWYLEHPRDSTMSSPALPAPEQLVTAACRAEGGGNLASGKAALKEFLIQVASPEFQQRELHRTLMAWLG